MITITEEEGETVIWHEPEGGPCTGLCIGSDPDKAKAFQKAEATLRAAITELRAAAPPQSMKQWVITEAAREHRSLSAIRMRIARGQYPELRFQANTHRRRKRMFVL